MSKVFNIETRQGFRFRDSRAVMAALAMLIAGVLLSLMVQQYFAAHDADQPFTRSRMWWEVVMNLQLLAIGMMWFSYSDTIPETPGRLRQLQIMRRWLGVGSVAMPALLAICSMFMDGFKQIPGPQLLAVLAAIAALHFAVSVMLRRRAEGLFPVSNNAKTSLTILVLYFSPTLILLSVAFNDLTNGSWLCLLVAPTLLYIQAAMPYILHAVGIGKFPLFDLE